MFHGRVEGTATSVRSAQFTIFLKVTSANILNSSRIPRSVVVLNMKSDSGDKCKSGSTNKRSKTLHRPFWK